MMCLKMLYDALDENEEANDELEAAAKAQEQNAKVRYKRKLGKVLPEALATLIATIASSCGCKVMGHQNGSEFQAGTLSLPSAFGICSDKAATPIHTQLAKLAAHPKVEFAF